MCNKDEDTVAVKSVLAGNTAAFAGIVERWQSPLVNLAYRFCRDSSRAEDMAQEAFLRAYRKLETFRGEASFSTWLFALATNVYRDEVRRVTPTLVAFNAETDGSSAPGAEYNAEQADQQRLVQTALLSLPEKYRVPLLLFYFHEQNVAETAATLNLPVGTVKARLSRGRKQLAAKLEQRL